jgi:tRNA-specific adenosine deaminase 3
MRYTTARDIQPDEELCIFYGHKSSFIPVPIQDIKKEHPISQWNDITTSSFIEAANCGGLLAVDCQDDQDIKNPYLEGDPNEGIPQEELPFTKLKPPPDEEDSKSIRTSYVISSNRFRRNSSRTTVNAWAVDVPDPRHIPSLLK